MSGAQKISSRSRPLAASDTKALFLRAEALLALEKGPQGFGIFKQ